MKVHLDLGFGCHDEKTCERDIQIVTGAGRFNIIEVPDGIEIYHDDKAVLKVFNDQPCADLFLYFARGGYQVDWTKNNAL